MHKGNMARMPVVFLGLTKLLALLIFWVISFININQQYDYIVMYMYLFNLSGSNS